MAHLNYLSIYLHDKSQLDYQTEVGIATLNKINSLLLFIKIIIQNQ